EGGRPLLPPHLPADPLRRRLQARARAEVAQAGGVGLKPDTRCRGVSLQRDITGLRAANTPAQMAESAEEIDARGRPGAPAPSGTACPARARVARAAGRRSLGPCTPAPPRPHPGRSATAPGHPIPRTASLLSRRPRRHVVRGA